MRLVSVSDFNNVHFAIGRAMQVQPNKSAKIPAYLLNLDFGPELTSENAKISKKNFFVSSAQLCTNHNVEDLVNQLMLSVISFPRKQIGKVMSDCLVTGVQSPEGTPDEKRETTVFMTPSFPVEPGQRVGILGEKTTSFSLTRDLSWEQFTSLDLRIGTITTIANTEPVNFLKKAAFGIDLGLGLQSCIGLLDPSFDETSLLNRQVLVLSNLDEDSKIEYFGDASINSILCSVNGEAALCPAKPVANGFKLA